MEKPKPTKLGKLPKVIQLKSGILGIHNSQNQEITQMFTNRNMNEQILVYTCHRILLCNKNNKHNIDTTWMISKTSCWAKEYRQERAHNSMIPFIWNFRGKSKSNGSYKKADQCLPRARGLDAHWLGMGTLEWQKYSIYRLWYLSKVTLKMSELYMM